MYRRKPSFATIFIFLNIIPICIYPATIFVYSGGSGSGTSWSDAYGSIQTAITNASNGDDILVGYDPSGSTTSGNSSRRYRKSSEWTKRSYPKRRS